MQTRTIEHCKAESCMLFDMSWFARQREEVMNPTYDLIGQTDSNSIRGGNFQNRSSHCQNRTVRFHVSGLEGEHQRVTACQPKANLHIAIDLRALDPLQVMMKHVLRMRGILNEVVHVLIQLASWCAPGFPAALYCRT